MDMNSKVRFLLDEAFVLRDLATAPDTASTNGSLVVWPDNTTQAYWDNNETATGDLTVGIVVSAFDTTSDDETYAVAVQFTDASGNNPTTVASLPIRRTGSFILQVDDSAIEQILVSNRARLRVVSTLGGTTPSLTYGAYVVGGSMHNYS